MATIDANTFAISFIDAVTRMTNISVFEVDFGTRNVTPVCVPSSSNYTLSNVTSIGDDTECSQIVYRRDGSIGSSRQINLGVSSQVSLFTIGRGYMFGTWNDQGSQRGFVANSTSVSTFATLASRSIMTAVATPREVILGFRYDNRVALARYNYDMSLMDVTDVPIASSVVNLDVQYNAGSDALSLVVATSSNILVQIYMRDNSGAFAMSNEATLATLSTPIQVLDIAQVVLPSSDLAVTYSTIQEIRVQVLSSTIWKQLDAGAPASDSGPQPKKRLPSWAIALIIISSLIVVGVVSLVVWIQIKKRRLRNSSRDEPMYLRM